MKVTETTLPGVLLVEPRRFSDARGSFFEVWKEDRYVGAGIVGPFVQDNVSHSVRGTLRGLHFQEPSGQGKLVQALHGAVYDVVVDVRRGSPTFGRSLGVVLDAETGKQLWIPPGFAHGFCVTSAHATFLYKCTAAYSPEHERSIRWDDPALCIEWPLDGVPLLSPKDAIAPLLADAQVLPGYA